MQIHGLASTKGLALNGQYGKVTSLIDANTQRLGIQVSGVSVAIKPNNLILQSKLKDIKSEDEEALLNLVPTSHDGQALPWMERMRALGLIEPQK